MFSFFTFILSFVFALMISFPPGGPENLMGPGTERLQIISSTDRLRVDLEILKQKDFDIAGTNWEESRIEVITDPRGARQLSQLGFQFEALPGLNAPDPRYLNPQTLAQNLLELEQRFPHLARRVEIGRSVRGQPIWALFISNQPKDLKQNHKPSLLVDGVHHAREVMTAEVVQDIGEEFLKLVQTQDPWALKILQRWNLWLVPILNIDGSDLVFSKDPMWRKNARGQANRVYGVDINRNYNFQWNACGGSSGFQMAQDYRGPSTASEPETQAMQDLAQNIQPSAYLSYHSYSEMVLVSYGCNGKRAPDETMVLAVADEVARMLPTDSGKNFYKVGTPWELIYPVDGDSSDYMVREFGALGLGFEINTSFQPHYSERTQTLTKHRLAWKKFLSLADELTLSLSILGKSSQKPEDAWVDFAQNSTSSFEKTRKSTGGFIHQALPLGNRTLLLQDARGKSHSWPIQHLGRTQLRIELPD